MFIAKQFRTGSYAVILLSISQKVFFEFGGSSFELTKNELRILICLAEKKGTIVSREETNALSLEQRAIYR